VLNRLSFKPGDVVDTREIAAASAVEGLRAVQGRADEDIGPKNRLFAAGKRRQRHGLASGAAARPTTRAGGQAPLRPANAISTSIQASRLATSRRLRRAQRGTRLSPTGLSARGGVSFASPPGTAALPAADVRRAAAAACADVAAAAGRRAGLSRVVHCAPSQPQRRVRTQYAPAMAGPRRKARGRPATCRSRIIVPASRITPLPAKLHAGGSPGGLLQSARRCPYASGNPAPAYPLAPNYAAPPSGYSYGASRQLRRAGRQGRLPRPAAYPSALRPGRPPPLYSPGGPPSTVRPSPAWPRATACSAIRRPR